MVTFAVLVLLQATPDRVFSGPQPGEATAGFKVLDLSGPSAGKEVDHVAEWKGAPAVICFIHELTRPGAQLMRRLDDYGTRNRDRLRTLFVSLADDPGQAERSLPRSVKALDLRAPVGISLDGKEGPGSYGLNKAVTLTVLAARDNRVAGNWAILSPNETDFAKIEPVLEKLIEPALDTPEAMRAEILRLRAELGALRAEVDTLRQGLRTDRARARAAGGEGMEKRGEREGAKDRGKEREKAKEREKEKDQR